MSQQLKPCPFCGGTPELSDRWSIGRWHFVECSNVACRCLTPDCQNVDDAVAIWNRRPEFHLRASVAIRPEDFL